MAGLPAYASTLRIFPSRAALEHALQADGRDALVADGFVTFQSLVDSLVGGARVAAGNVAGRMLVRAVLLAGPARYRAFAHDPVAVRAMHGALLELRTCGITTSVASRGKNDPALADLLSVVAAYEAGLVEHQLVDDADKQRDAVLAVAQGALPPPLMNVREIILEGVGELFGSRLDLLTTFAARGVRVRVRFPFDSARRSEFAWTEATLAMMEGRSQTSIREGGRALDAHLQSLEIEQDPRLLRARTRICHVPEPAEEARRVAATVVAWLHAGVPANAIAVATPDTDGLAELIVRALARFDVPVRARRGPSVMRVRRVAALLGAMRLPSFDFRREEMLDAWMALGEPVAFDGGTIGVADVAREVRASGARSRSIRGYREALLAIAQGRRASAHSDTHLRRATAIADALDVFIERFSTLPQRAPMRDHVRAVQALVSATRAQPLAKLADGSPAPAAFADEAGLDALTDVLGDMMASAAFGGEAPMTRDVFVQWLDMLASERRVPLEGGRTARVLVGSLDDVVGASYRCIAIAGVDGEQFPRRIRPDLILTDDMRAALNRKLGTRLVQSAPIDGRPALENDARDRWLWREALAAASDEVLVTYGVREGRESEGRSDAVNDLLREQNVAIEFPVPTYAEPQMVAAAQAHEAHAFACLASSPGIVPVAPAVREALTVGVHGERSSWIGLRVANEILAVSGKLMAAFAEQDRRALETYVFDNDHSVSNLDRLGKCKYLHFAKGVLRLYNDAAPDLAPEPRHHGSAAHEALRYVYEDIIEHGGLAAARRDGPRALERAREVFDAKREAILREVPIHPALEVATLERAFREVRIQLKRDLDSGDPLEPVKLEYGFNGEAHLELTEPGGTRKLLTHGSIDRVDRGPGRVAVFDYKSSQQKVEPGRHFQLALYGAVATRDFAKAGDALSAAWLLLTNGEVQTDPELGHDFVGTLEQTLWPRIQALLAGNLAPDPASQKVCTYCDFRALCRFAAPLDDTEEPDEEAAL